MTRNTSRTSEERELNTREETEYTFEEPSTTDIPKEVEERFANEGMSLRWLRIDSQGQEDYQSIGKSMQRGWTFVSLCWSCLSWRCSFR